MVPRLTHKSLFNWHKAVMAGHRGIEVIRAYRKHADPMQMISGPIGREKVHFEAPSSNQGRAELGAFVKWFNGSAPDEKSALPTLTRAGIAHLCFESIHPFEDGNGRIGRALSEKAIMRMFREGIDGFKGSLSAETYIRITSASRATATRDLQDLVEKGALTRTREWRHTRYWLNAG